MSETDLLFPYCGITLGDVLSCQGMSKKDAARRLGVNLKHFYEVIAEHGLGHLFPRRHRYSDKKGLFKGLGITAEDVASCHGLLQKDAADVLGVGYGRFNAVIRKDPDLRRLFPAKGGEARYIAEHGYT